VSIYNSYLETEVMSAEPVELIRLLYRSAISRVGAARGHLAAGAIRERSDQIAKALSIVHELMRSLDYVNGGEIARRLGELYAYISTRLIEANTQQVAEPLEEVERLLQTLMSAWAPQIRHAA
jgi:flagellar protein FliS